MKKGPETTVVISTHNRPQQLKKRLAEVLGQTYGDIEVVVADNGRDPATNSVARTFVAMDERVRYINTHHLGKGPTTNRNGGMAAANPDSLACFVIDDDDNLGDQHTLGRLVRPIISGHFQVVCGVQRVMQAGEIRTVYEGGIQEGQILDNPQAPQIPAKATAFGTQLIRRIGGISHIFKDSREDFGLVLDAILAEDGQTIYEDGAIVDFNLEQRPSVLNANILNGQLAASNLLVRQRALKLFGYES